MPKSVYFTRGCLWFALGGMLNKSHDFVDPITGLPINLFIIAAVAGLSVSHALEFTKIKQQ